MQRLIILDYRSKTVSEDFLQSFAGIPIPDKSGKKNPEWQLHLKMFSRGLSENSYVSRIEQQVQLEDFNNTTKA